MTTTFCIGDIANFYRTMGSSDNRQRRRKQKNYNIGKAIVSPDVANASAVGATLGLTVDAATNNPLAKAKSATKLAGKKGLLARLARNKTRTLGLGGMTVGAGMGVASKLKKQKQKRRFLR